MVMNTGTLYRSLHSFRKSFQMVNNDVLHWFPGHMTKGLKQIEKKLINVDCVIEVHDARIPLSGRNPNFKHNIIGSKPHILVLNKKDLANLKEKEKINNILKAEQKIENVIFTNCKDHMCKGITQVLATTFESINNAERFNRENSKEYNVLVIGVPNVGKSSLINALRSRSLNKGKATAVGAVAGITRSMQTRIKVNEDPLTYILDTPGILTPNVPNIESGMRLALCATLQDHLVGPEVIADYLLYWMNKTGNFKYVDYMGLEGPVDNIGTVLVKCAIKINNIIKVKTHEGYKKRPNIHAASEYFIKLFREGNFGRVMLDDDLIQ